MHGIEERRRRSLRSSDPFPCPNFQISTPAQFLNAQHSLRHGPSFSPRFQKFASTPESISVVKVSFFFFHLPFKVAGRSHPRQDARGLPGPDCRHIHPSQPHTLERRKAGWIKDEVLSGGTPQIQGHPKSNAHTHTHAHETKQKIGKYPAPTRRERIATI